MVKVNAFVPCRLLSPGACSGLLTQEEGVIPRLSGPPGLVPGTKKRSMEGQLS